MSVRFVEDIRTLDITSCRHGDVLVYCELTEEGRPCPGLPWIVSCVPAAGGRTMVARFTCREDAECFTVAYQASIYPGIDVRRVLVVVHGGMARAYATPGVMVAIADLDSRRQYSEHELAPIDIGFRALLESACVDWPLSSRGRCQSATVVAYSSKTSPWAATTAPGDAPS